MYSDIFNVLNFVANGQLSCLPFNWKVVFILKVLGFLMNLWFDSCLFDFIYCVLSFYVSLSFFNCWYHMDNNKILKYQRNYFLIPMKTLGKYTSLGMRTLFIWYCECSCLIMKVLLKTLKFLQFFMIFEKQELSMPSL